MTQLEQAGVPIAAAFWYWEEDGEQYRLVIASPPVDEQGAPAFSKRLVAIFQQQPALASVLFSRVFAVGEHDRLLERARTGLVDASFLIEPPVQAA